MFPVFLQEDEGGFKMSKRTYGVTRKVFAGCHQCNGSDAMWFGKNAQAVAARHHDATGHITWVDIAMSITYGEVIP